MKMSNWKNTSTIFVFISSYLLYLISNRSRIKKKLKRKNRSLKTISLSSDMGRCFGVDIGGTLAKIVYFEQKKNTEFMKRPRSNSHNSAMKEMNSVLLNNDSYGNTGFRDAILGIESEKLGGTLHFIRFETKNMKEAIQFIAQHDLNQTVHTLSCTGGGAYKYSKMLKQMASINIEKYDEIECLVKGLNFFVNYFPNAVYTFQNIDFRTLEATQVFHFSKEKDKNFKDIFPYLIVNIGSGVSILNVSGPNEYERISGSSIGGGSYWGLCRSLTKCKTYDDALDIAVDGDNFMVDMSVGDIYGGDYEKFDLPASTVASSFGKMMTNNRDQTNTISDCHIARSLLIMITQNIGQIAYLNACLYQTKKIFFVGNFLRHNKISNRTLAYAINFWSKGKMEAHFCHHEGYLGAIGAFLYNLENIKTE